MKDTVEGTSLLYRIIAGSQVFIRRNVPGNLVHRFSFREMHVSTPHGFHLLFPTNYSETAQRVKRSKNAAHSPCSACVEDKARLQGRRYNTGLQNRRSTIHRIPRRTI